MLPRDLSQLILNELVYSQLLTDISIQAFRDCALQVTERKLSHQLASILLSICHISFEPIELI